MAKQIRNIIIEKLDKMNICDKELLLAAIKKIEKKEIKNNILFTEHLSKALIENEITYVKDFLNLTIEEATNILKIETKLTENYIKSIIVKLAQIIIKYKEKHQYIVKSKEIHPKLKNLIENLKEDKEILRMLKEDILYREEINTLDEKESKNIKPWRNSRLELNNNELNLLRKYIEEKITEENIIRNLNNQKGIINIYEKLVEYINKIEYKKIITKKYDKIESLELTKNDINALKRNQLFTVADIVEYSEKEFSQLRLIGIVAFKNITSNLKEKNISFSQEKKLTKNKKR